MDEDARAFGIQPSDLPEPDRRFAVLPSNWDTVMAFMAVQTQWRYVTGADRSIRLGLDYASCRAVLDARQMDVRVVFPGLQMMESEILEKQHL